MIHKIFVLFSILTLLVFSAHAEEASDISLSTYPPVAWTLSKGSLQAGAYLAYTNTSLGKALGADIGDNNDSVGSYQEEGGHLWFGLSDNDTVSFQFSLSAFEYGVKEAEASFQEFRYKRSLIQNNPYLGFLSAELAWRRHSTNELINDGVSLGARSNTMSDHGFGGRLLLSRSFGAWDFHTHLGYNDYDDSDNGQSVIEAGFGFTRFWASRYQLDLFYQHYSIDRDNPTNSRSSDSNNTFSVGIKRHFNDSWSMELRGQYNDNLFRGYWPYLDDELDKQSISFSNYGYFTLGLTYRTKY
ncbi:MAG: hypothetical protein HQL32_04275 [Planctomycetes bacterium]|nr:hypothetical protein [Planctomycetota bacterium]